jgi:fructuronate reductase
MTFKPHTPLTPVKPVTPVVPMTPLTSLAPFNSQSLPAVAARAAQATPSAARSNAQSAPAPNSIKLPGYARTGAVGVVHLGLGAFHRAHQALVFDGLLQSGDTRWGVLGVAMRSTALADALAAQDGLYAVQIASSAGVHWQVGGAIFKTCVAAREPATVVQAMAAPATRWVTLTVTEKGYTPELGTLLVQGLAARHAAGGAGLTLASCDNLSGNGRVLQRLCVQAAQYNPLLADWITQHCAFPNSMVDRIVPAATPERLAAAAQALGVADQCALGTEAFWEWVIERRFVDEADGALLASMGVTVVDDVGPFEEAKLRLLNGSHSAMACIGAVAGLPVIGDCAAQPAVRQFIHGLMTHEVGPHQRRPHWLAYRDALMVRWDNPALQHSVHQIATDSSQKIPQRWPPSVLGQMKAGQPYERLAFSAAIWMRYLRGVNETGQPYVINDPMAERLQALAVAHQASDSASVQALGTLPEIWGDALPHDAQWLARVNHWLTQINEQGVLAALALCNG